MASPSPLPMKGGSALDIPFELWDQIISNLDGDRDLESLSLVCTYLLSITNRLKHTLNISHPASDMLPSLFRRFPNLKSLDLSRQKLFPVEVLKQLPASTLSGIKSLNFCSLSSLGDDDLDLIPNLFPNLEELDLSHLDPDTRYADDDDRLQGWCGNRYPMPYYHHKKTTDDGISVLVSKLKGLRRINLHQVEGISDKVLVSLSDNCPNLEEIVLKESQRYWFTIFTHTGIQYALRSCQRLKTIILHGNDDWEMDQICKAICCTPSLSKIEFHRWIVYDAFLSAMAEAYLPFLESFTLSHCELDHNYTGNYGGMPLGLTYGGLLSFLKTYDSLDHLGLEGVEFLNDFSMATLIAKYLKKVRVVKLNHSALSGSTLFTLIEQCPLLESVEMKHTNIGPRREKKGGSRLNSQIKTLNLSYNEYLNDEFLKRIALACPHLEKVQLRSCRAISGIGVGYIMRNCRGLKHLRIDGCSGVKNLDLERNTSTHYKLELLGASYSGIGDQDLFNVSEKCPHLMFLNVKECQALTSKGLKEVAHKCSKLKEINFQGCRNVSSNILPWMVFCKPNLRKIGAPVPLCASEPSLYLRHGCDVKCQDYFHRMY